ncbi:MAG TPA: IS21 family transposase [Bacteroidales bacterium]|nr:IS21 family transposase [Bacteroidales bacterium]
MDTKQEIIRRFFRENDSERKIARDLQLHRKTVKKYITEYLEAQSKAEVTGTTGILQEYSSSPPLYNSSKRVKRKMISEIEALIIQQLEDNERKKREGLRKQIKRKVDIHEHILSQGYQIGYTTICNYIRQKELSLREAYIRQVYQPGEECEFDWAEVKIKVAGQLKRLYLAVFTSSYCNYRFSRLYNRQDTLAFMESHNDFFTHIGGVFHEMVYDNMRVAVAEFVGRHEKQPTRALTSLSGWYHFRWRFCNVRRGNEKGHVERSVEYVRRKAFSHKDEFESLEHAQQHMESVLKRLNNLAGKSNSKSHTQMLQEEKQKLWKYPGEMECYLMENLKVDKYSTLSYGTNHYSVPDYSVGRIVDVKIYSNQLKVYYNNQQICQHSREYGMHQWVIKLEHYLRTLSRKPGALHGSAALEQALPEIKSLYSRFFINQPKGFIDILLYCQQNQVPHERLIDTVYYLNELCPKDVSSDKVIALLGNQPTEQVHTLKSDKTDEIEDQAKQQLKEISQLITSGIN